MKIKLDSYQQQYYDITKRIIEEPHKVGSSRIGDMNSRFCEQMRIDLSKEFPIMDIKWIKFENVVHELIWMVRGETNIRYLIDNDCHIWTDDAYRYYKEKYSPYRNDDSPQLELFDKNMSKKVFVEKIMNREEIKKKMGHSFAGDHYMTLYNFGDMEKIYGYQWRKFNGRTDQLQNVINSLTLTPDDRRMIITGLNPTDLEDGNVGLPSCHNYMQFYTTINEDGSRNLNTFCNIRSNDWFLGQPYNVVQYALLTHMIANIVNMGVGELVINAVDAHLYHEHFEPAKEWLRRFEAIPANDVIRIGNVYYKNTYCRADLKLNDAEYVDTFKPHDFKLENYNPQPYIKAKLLT